MTESISPIEGNPSPPCGANDSHVKNDNEPHIETRIESITKKNLKSNEVANKTI